MTETVAYRTCPLCEATCGLEVTVRDGVPVKVRPDHEDVFSRGFVCPKGASLLELHDDPDRVRVPLVKQADGSFAEATWDEAFALIAERLPAIQAAHGRDSVAAYLGNPSAHSLGPMIYGRVLLKALGTKNIFSASTVDQYPKQLAAAHMFGSGSNVPIPDLDRTDFLLILGANPLASNGSLMTAPDVRGRLAAIRGRGGKVVVVDPRRTRTAQAADEHLFIRPGTDALLLFAIAHVVFGEGLVDLGAAEGLVAGLDEVRALAAGFPPDAVAPVCGIDAEVIERLARELAAAPTAAVYGRIGTTTQSFGAVASWLVDVLNVITGNLDRPGGAMFTRPAAGGGIGSDTGRGRGARFGRFTSRVRGAGEVFGELPAACMAEEIETPGDGQVRALITLAGNPVLSTPNSDRLDAALASLEFMVAVDIYVNETTRHADVILPAPAPFEKAHYDLALYGFAVRDVANWSDPVVERPAGMLDEWETLLRLVGVVTGQGADADVAAIDRFVATTLVQKECGDEHSVAGGLDVDAVLGVLDPLVGSERVVDLMLRCGPYGAGFPELDRPGPGTLTLAALKAAPHGIDLGALKPRLPGVLRTPTGMIELAPPALVADVERLADRLADGAGDPDAMVLVGRRDLRSNNSWMHNLPKLVSGPARCTVWVHPDDAARLGVEDGADAVVRARTGEIRLPVLVTDDVMRGVVSVPHGWGHGGDGVGLRVAAEHAGVNSNVLTDELELEPLSGTAVLNGIPVSVAPVREPVAAA